MEASFDNTAGLNPEVYVRGGALFFLIQFIYPEPPIRGVDFTMQAFIGVQPPITVTSLS